VHTGGEASQRVSFLHGTACQFTALQTANVCIFLVCVPMCSVPVLFAFLPIISPLHIADTLSTLSLKPKLFLTYLPFTMQTLFEALKQAAANETCSWVG